MTILDIRGTHGSGKSYLIHRLLSVYDNIPILEENTHLGYVLPEINSVVLGKYGNKCGGCDGIKSPDEVVRRINHFNSLSKNVILEGILVSHTFQRYSNLAQELQDYRFLFLDTPLETCILNVKRRRKEAGNLKPFDPRNVEHDHKQIWTNVQSKCRAAKHRVTVLDHRHAWRQLGHIVKHLAGAYRTS